MGATRSVDLKYPGDRLLVHFGDPKMDGSAKLTVTLVRNQPGGTTIDRMSLTWAEAAILRDLLPKGE